MSIKAKAPEEDPETVARREAAEARADAGRIDETRDNLGLETRSILRQFGRQRAGSVAGAINPGATNSGAPGLNAFGRSQGGLGSIFSSLVTR